MSSYTLITMSAGISMKIWQETGLIVRELGYYSRLSEHIGRLGFLTYGDNLCREQELLHKYLPGAEISWNIPEWLLQYKRGHLAASFIPPLKKEDFFGCKLVRSNQMLGAWTGAMIAKRLGVPFILRCGYNFCEHFEKQKPDAVLKKKLIFHLERWVARQADAVIVTFPGLKDYFVERHRIPRDRIHVIGNPIDTELFKPQKISPERDIISIGRFTEQKNYLELIRACGMTGANLALLGSGHLHEKMARFAAELSVDLHFYERVENDQIPSILARHRLFVLPSLYEGNPKALLEAMSCGMACVASRIREHENIITDGHSGFLCEHSADSIAEAVAGLLKNEKRRKQLGRAAREKIVREYSAEKNAKKEAFIHEALLHSKKIKRCLI